ncbi:MAG: S-methyl-5'-thioinosine phosphorylase [Gammaproteobacteria bacterium]|nr:S-methyl-5'-thioinosine phosphorylase [Gammaproteobacteria bacterium]
MMKYAVIGGSGLYKIDELLVTDRIRPTTPYGKISDDIVVGTFAKHELYFLPRHGVDHAIPPHKVNYQANIWALNEAGISGIIAVNAVGGIASNLKSGNIVIPEQIIDYTYGREHTYSDGTTEQVNHVDFSHPFDRALRHLLIEAVNKLDSSTYHIGGVYGCTQGPRFETAAEIQRMKNDGCTVVGMTAMPEASLARELSIPYVGINIVANMAPGISDEIITIDDIFQVVEKGNSKVLDIIRVMAKS